MKAQCLVCRNRCNLEEGQTGACRARRNVDGRVVSINYGQLTGMALDPIEKKPLKRFYPGSMILSVGSFGCNLVCPFCQNYEISMASQETAGAATVSPEELVHRAVRLKCEGNIGIAYTYNEPLVGWEYVRDTARLARNAGLKNVIVTNGSVSREILEEVLPLTDAMNIDLKGFTEEYYRKLGGDLETVKQFIRRASQACHVELTTLIVPGENDSPQEMEAEAAWIASLDSQIPLHVTRFFPRWKMRDREATAVADVYALAQVAGAYLEYVWVGNC